MPVKKLFVVKCCEAGLGRYNATHIYTLHIVASNERDVISSVLKSDTISVEIVSIIDFVEI